MTGPVERPGELQEGPKRTPGGPQESPQDRPKRTQGVTRLASRQADKPGSQAGRAGRPDRQAGRQTRQASRQAGSQTSQAGRAGRPGRCPRVFPGCPKSAPLKYSRLQ